jgi:hypothetical protein
MSGYMHGQRTEKQLADALLFNVQKCSASAADECQVLYETVTFTESTCELGWMRYFFTSGQCESVTSKNMLQDSELALDKPCKDETLALATFFNGEESSNVLHTEAKCGQLQKSATNRTFYLQPKQGSVMAYLLQGPPITENKRIERIEHIEGTRRE